MIRICWPLAFTGCPWPFAKELSGKRINTNNGWRCLNRYFFVQKRFIYTIISIVKAYVEVAWYLGRFSLHVLIMHGGERHQFRLFLFPIVVSIVFLLLEWLFIQSLQFLPEILIKLFQWEILAFFKFVEEALLENAYCIFYRTFPVFCDCIFCCFFWLCDRR